MLNVLSVKKDDPTEKKKKHYINLAMVIFEIYFYLENWHLVRFANKVDFGYNILDKARIFQKASKGY